MTCKIIWPLFFLSIAISCQKVVKNSIDLLRNESYDCLYPSHIEKDVLTIMHWNIGHFSNGSSPYSTIEDKDLKIKVNQYRKLFDNCLPDFISLNEYSDIIGTHNGEEYFTRDVIFSQYPYAYIGIQNNYSCNAMISHFPLSQVRYNIFNCNTEAQISHTSIIRSEEYYYLSSTFQWKDKIINFISTHLAFDNNNPEIVKAQIKEVISKFDSCYYVIICGDWNTSPESYRLFEDNGYQLLNCGKFGQHITFPSSSMYLDNILTKGISILDISIIETDLSDHYPIMCKIRLKDN